MPKSLPARRRQSTRPEAAAPGMIRAAASTAKNQAGKHVGPAFFHICGSVGDYKLEAAVGDKKLRRFTMTAYTGGPMQVPGWYYPVVCDLSQLTGYDQSRPILYQHDPTSILGHTEKIDVAVKTIKVAGVISGVGEKVDEVVTTSDNGFPWQSSIGAYPASMDFIEAGRTVRVNGRTVEGPVYVARGALLREISFTAMGADDKTSAKMAASAALTPDGASTMNFEQWLAAKGFSPEQIQAMNDTSKKFLQAMFDEETAGDPADPPKPSKPKKGIKAKAPKVVAGAAGGDPLDGDDDDDDDDTDPGLGATKQIRAAAAAEVKRIAAVQKICVGGQHAEIQAKAIEEGWDEARTELHILRAERGSGPAIHSRSHEKDCTADVLAYGLMLRAGLNPVDKNADDETRKKQAILAQQAHRFRDMSMFDVLREAGRIDGKSIYGTREEVIRAAFSGGTAANIFTTNVNARLLSAFLEAPDTTQGWCSETDVSNFKKNERTSLGKEGGLKKLPRGGKAKHAQVNDKKEEYKIARYAKQLVIDEQDFIDDDMGALNEKPIQMGQAARRLRPDLVYAMLLINAALGQDNVAWFHATHTNLATGAGSALAIASLEAAAIAMAKQTEDGVKLNISPRFLIVPQDLRFTAAKLLRSAEVRDTTASTKYPTYNALQDLTVELRTDNRIGVAGVTDPDSEAVKVGTATNWFLFGAPADGARTIEVGYLAGTGRVPSVRQFQLDQGSWGLGWDIKMDIGCKGLAYQACYKSDGNG